MASKVSNSSDFYHALRIDEGRCIGCSHCSRVCPTEAIRVKDGKARLYNNRCVDCGECYRVCPVLAIYVEQDDLNLMFNYQKRVALIPSVFWGQFPGGASTMLINKILLELGFTDIFPVEETAGYLAGEINEYIKANREVHPMIISSFCPAVVRMIQVRFPGLVERVARLKTPVDVAALYIKEKLAAEGYNAAETGVFYVSPCAAKMVAVKDPLGEEISAVTGVINMDFLYNKVYKRMLSEGVSADIPESSLIKNSFGYFADWALTGGEAEKVNQRCLAIDDINNVIEILEKVEQDEIKGISYLEMRACDQGCAGGILVVGNRFLITDKIRRNRRKTWQKPDEYGLYEGFMHDNLQIGPIEPRSILKFDDNMAAAMRKMQRARRMMCYLPGIDCGACGAPTCQALSEDIAHGTGNISDCIFMQRNMEKNGSIHSETSLKIMERIWGKDRFDKDCTKKGAENEIN